VALPTILLASTTTAAGAVNTTGSEVHIPGNWSGMAFVLDVTAAATDAGDTLDVKVQARCDGTNYIDVVHFTQCVGNGGAKRHIAKISSSVAQAMFENAAALGAGNVRNLLAEVWRVAYAQVDADSNGTFTFSVTACPM